MLTHERLLTLLDYVPETGDFFWKGDRRRAGRAAGGINARGYRFIIIDGFRHQSARLAWFYVNGRWPERRLFAKNGEKLDCSFSNLVEAEKGRFNHSHGDGRRNYERSYRAKESLPLKEARLKYRFGISLEEHQALLLAQKGVCAICEMPETSSSRGRIRQLAVDHDHLTGEVRGLLCFRCNTAVGKFRDSPEILVRAASYLRRSDLPANVVPLKKGA